MLGTCRHARARAKKLRGLRTSTPAQTQWTGVRPKLRGAPTCWKQLRDLGVFIHALAGSIRSVAKALADALYARIWTRTKIAFRWTCTEAGRYKLFWPLLPEIPWTSVQGTIHTRTLKNKLPFPVHVAGVLDQNRPGRAFLRPSLSGDVPRLSLDHGTKRTGPFDHRTSFHEVATSSSSVRSARVYRG